jgi:hypothetical protein
MNPDQEYRWSGKVLPAIDLHAEPIVDEHVPQELILGRTATQVRPRSFPDLGLDVLKHALVSVGAIGVVTAQLRTPCVPPRGTIASMRTATLTVAALAAIGALLSAPAAVADPGCWDSPNGCGGHSWNGPLRQTWNTPGFYGGNNGGDPEICSPFDYTCRGAIPTR